MKHDTSLYMFALMPPPELSTKIHQKRIDFFEKYKFVKALKPPVHITLYPPFQLNETSSPEFEKHACSIQNWADKQSPFQIELLDYNFFENPRHPVVFIDVVKNTILKELHSEFLKEIRKYIEVEEHNVSYRPHITIGYRDVTPETFPAIKADYSKQHFADSFLCSAFYLWKHNGKHWEVKTEFKLNGKEEQLHLF